MYERGNKLQKYVEIKSYKTLYGEIKSRYSKIQWQRQRTVAKSVNFTVTAIVNSRNKFWIFAYPEREYLNYGVYTYLHWNNSFNIKISTFTRTVLIYLSQNVVKRHHRCYFQSSPLRNRHGSRRDTVDNLMIGYNANKSKI